MNTRSTIVRMAIAISLSVTGQLSAQSLRQHSTEGGGVWLGPLNISPFLNLSALYDSNVDFVREGELKENDVENGRDREKTGGYTLQPGVDLLMPGNGWQLDGRAFFKLEEYSEDFAESRKDWCETLNWYGETENGTGLRLSQMMQQVVHDDTDWADRWNDRREMRFAGHLGKPLSDKNKIGLSGYYHEIKYDDEELFDWDRVGGTLTLATKLSDKTDGLLVGGFSTHSSEDQEGNAESLTAHAGFASRATDKTSYRTTLGVERYSGFDGDDSELGLSYDLGATWRASERMTLGLSGRSAYEPAEDVGQNSMLVSTIGLVLNYRPLERWALTVGGAYRREDYTREIELDAMQPITMPESGRDRTDDQLSGHAQVVFGLNRYASIFAGGNYTYTTSSIEEFDYKRWRVNAGMALRY